MDLKLGRLAQVAFPVADVDRSIAFFEGELGLKLLFRPHETLAFFDLDGVRLFVEKASTPEEVAKASILYLLCEDIAVAAAELADAAWSSSTRRTASPSSRPTISG